MECKKCGKALPENAKFCFECGAKVEVEIVCSSCGTKLIPDAKFCVECGKPIGKNCIKSQDNTLPVNNDWDEILQAVDSESGITGILETLSPVATHTELYAEGYKGGGYGTSLNTVYNNGWIFRYETWGVSYLFEENGSRIENIDLRDIIGCAGLPLGMNNRGIWFGIYDEEIREFVCLNFETNEQKRIKIIESRENIRRYYIVGSKVYYAAEGNDQRQEFVVIDIDTGAECVLHKTDKGEKIIFICAYETWIAFGKTDEDGRGVNFWYGNAQERDVPEFKKLGTIEDEIRIQFINLRKKTIWTTMTEKERVAFNGGRDDLVERPLGEPIEFKVFAYKERNIPRIYKIPVSCCGIDYFDGEDAYTSECGRDITRIDRNGNKYQIGPFLHGNGSVFLVTDSHVYVDYSSYDGVVRLPRKFHGTEEEFAHRNPEAETDYAQSRWNALR